MRRKRSTTSASRRHTGSKPCAQIVPVSTACASTINGVYALNGAMATPMTLRLPTTTETVPTMTEQLPPNHLGCHLAESLDEYELTLYRLAKEIGVQPTRIDQIVKGKRSITADTSLRLGRFFGTTPAFWMNLQTNYDLAVTGAELGDSLDAIHPLTA